MGFDLLYTIQALLWLCHLLKVFLGFSRLVSGAAELAQVEEAPSRVRNRLHLWRCEKKEKTMFDVEQ